MRIPHFDLALLVDFHFFQLAIFAHETVKFSRRLLLVDLHLSFELETAALFTEAAYSAPVLPLHRVPTATEHILRVVVLTLAVRVCRHPVIVATILAFGAAATGEINAKYALALLLVRFCVAGVARRRAPVQRWQPLASVLPIRQILIVPDVVVVVAFDVRRVLLRDVVGADLLSGGPLEEL